MRRTQWQAEWQHQRQYTGGYQHTHYPSSHSHLSSRLGLDVSRLAFGPILRDYTKTPATSPAMENILDRFWQYDYGIHLHRRNLNHRTDDVYKGPPRKGDTPLVDFLRRFHFELPGPPTLTHAAWYLEFVLRLCRNDYPSAMDFIKMQGGYVEPAWYEKKWSVGTEGWIWYGSPWSCRGPKPSAILKPKYPTAPPTVIRAKGSHIPPSSHCPTSGQSYHIEPAYSPVEAQAAPTSFKNVQPQTRAIPQTLSPIQDANSILTPTLTKVVPCPHNGRSAAESRLVGTKDYTLIEPYISQQHPPDIVSGGLPVPPPAPSKHAALSRVERECDTIMFDQYNHPQGVPDVSRPSAKKRRREDKGVEAGRTRKRKKVDNIQCDAMNGGSLAVDGNILNEPYQDLVRSSVGKPLPSYTLAPSPPVGSPPPWVPPVMNAGGYSPQDQALEPAPASRFTIGGGPGKKERCSVWHVWSKTRQELCESTEYFRSYQSGIYTTSTSKGGKNQLLGYLLDGFATSGDCWIDGGLMFISHGGGAKAREGEKVAPKTGKKKAMNPTRFVPVENIAAPRNTLDPHVSPNSVPTSSARAKSRLKDMTMYLGRDQTPDDLGVKSLQNAWRNKTRFVVTVGKKYGPFPWSPGYRPPSQDADGEADEDDSSYAVLGWYRVKSYWSEYEPGKVGIDGVPLFVRWRFLFEWVAEQGVPWWLRRPPVGESLPSTIGEIGYTIANLQTPVSVPRVHSESTPGMPLIQKWLGGRQSSHGCIVMRTCSACDKESPQVYAQGWFCTNWLCTQFSMFLNGKFSTQVTLSYAASFFGAKASPTNCGLGLVPEYLSVTPSTSHLKDLEAYSSAFWKGLCCPECGKLTCRTKWEFWECSQCKKPLNPDARLAQIYPAKDFTSSLCRQDSWSSGTRQSPLACHIFGQWMRADVYPLGSAGKVYHIYADPDDSAKKSAEPVSTSFKYDPDSMFEQYQGSANAGGMFRRFPFQRAFHVGVMLPRHYAHNAGAHYKFSVNMEGSTTSFKDSPQVVTTARDVLRFICKVFLSKDIPFNEVLSCAYKEEQKMGFHSDSETGVQGTIASLSLGSPAGMRFRPLKSHACKKASGNGAVVLQLELYHGDFVIMDGPDIQKLYEHEVVPKGFRFSATARHITS